MHMHSHTPNASLESSDGIKVSAGFRGNLKIYHTLPIYASGELLGKTISVTQILTGCLSTEIN